MRKNKASSALAPAFDVRIQGIPVSPGVVHGTIVLINQEEVSVPEREISPEDISDEIGRLETALVKTREQILKIRDHLSISLGEKDASIFDAHLLVVEDNTIVEAVKRQLAEKLICVESIYDTLTQSYAASMLKLDDPYLRERAADIRDIGRRVVHNLMGINLADAYQLDHPSIILAHDLSPSDTALFNRKMVLGFATEAGSKTSHTAIMARSLNIPAVVGLRHKGVNLEGKVEVILDGYEGVLIVNPSEKTKYEYGQIELRRMTVEEKLDLLRETIGLTRDNRHIILSANVELPEDLSPLMGSGAEGIGLYRTEFLFMNRLDYPSEEEQVDAYTKVIEASKPHLAIIRTLDVGGDKLLSEGGSDESNPFLGWRAIRYCLEHEDMFRTQLRAICLAGKGGKVRVMFPMISAYEELVKAKEILQSVRDELYRKGIAAAHHVEVGMMIEVPSAAMIVEHFAPLVDFFSIGTNDLVQYTLAVDRTNDKVAYLYQPTHPAVMRLIKRVVDVAHERGIWVGVCGEMAGEISLTPMLLGLGIDELSMGSIFIPRIKKAVQSLSFEECTNMVNDLMNFPSAGEIARRIEEHARYSYGELFD